ncbi:MAG: hypothetical protein HC876_23020, partial [Chloroflexaceae bacterium]|nr:hypothetical protein [Chloroflexaceae bacterium]
MSNLSSNPTLINVTISGNSAGLGGGGVFNANSSPSFTNSIIWGNNTQVSGGTPTYAYSLVQGETLVGTGNLPGTTDPLFIAPEPASSAPTTAGNYRLQPTSPVRDVGNNAANSTSTDLAGNPRIFNITIDLGAYEFQPLTGIIYVDKSRPDDSGDGLSWATAFRNLQTALALAGSGAQIWVADGTYYPDEGVGQTANARTSTFALKDGVAIYGGFAGTETLLTERDVAANVAILSGDLQQDDSQQPIITDITTVTGIGDNAYHVVSSDGNNNTARLDGFTITGGNADAINPNNRGGGVYNSSSSPSLGNLNIRGNRANNDGGGVYNFNSSPSLTDVTLSNNQAINGGAIYNNGGSPSFERTTINANTASSSGGGVYNITASARFTDTLIQSNTTNGSGGGVFTNGGSPSFTDVQIRDNEAGGNGGGVVSVNDSPRFTNVTISGNTATFDGGGVANAINSSPSFTNVTISGNTSTGGNGGGIANNNNCNPTFTNVQISNNTANGNGGGIYNLSNSTASLSATQILTNTAARGGGVYNDGSNPTFTNVRFSGNRATFTSGGGASNTNSSSPTFTNVTFSGNSANTSGGGVANLTNSTATFVNVQISGNSAGTGPGFGSGGGVLNEDSNPSFTNVTIARNRAGFSGSGVFNINFSDPTFINSIIWGEATNLVGNANNSNPTYQYSLVQGNSATTLNASTPSSNNNFNSTNPLFLNPIATISAPTTAGDYRLAPTSPAVDGGDNTANTTTTDLDGNPRVFNTTIDLGAYEVQTLPLAGIIYVDKSRPDDSGDGLSWATAFRNLQTALAFAGSGAEIWVADGTYSPNEGAGQTANDRDATFSLKDGVAIYGGFAGTEAALSERDVAANVAILSGDLQQNDTPPFGNNGDNAYHVVSSDGNTNTALLDGFTITGGNANGSFPRNRGGGIYTVNSSTAQFRALSISGNTASGSGGGVFNNNSSPSFTNVTISSNSANSGIGGGVVNQNSSATFTNVIISSNTGHSGRRGLQPRWHADRLPTSPSAATPRAAAAAGLPTRTVL